MLLGHLLEGMAVRTPGNAPGGLSGGHAADWAAVFIADITDDSRSVVPGSLFVARRGVRQDARRFIADAVRAGAAAVLAEPGEGFDPASISVPVVLVDDAQRAGAVAAERFYGNPSKALRLVGVTGTNGKTSVTTLIHQILNHAGIGCGLVGTVLTDDGRSVGPSSQTTPGAIELSQTLATMVECGRRAAALEVSSHALDQGRVQAISFDVGVFTNLTGDHQDYHGSMDAYAAAKARLFEMLPSDGVAVVNAMDPWHEAMLRRCAARVVRTGLRGTPVGRDGATVAVVGHWSHGLEVQLRGRWGELELRLPLHGEHNALNALQAAVAADALGVPSAAIAAALAVARPPRGRLETITGSRRGGPLVLVDYAHTDDALRHAMQAMRPVAEARRGQLVVVFGCGGDRDRTKRPRMGAVASELADRAIVTSDNPRTEDPDAIIAEILAGVPAAHQHKIITCADRRAAIERAVAECQDADVVVVAGKGHECEQILPDGRGGTRSVHFDDAEEVRRALDTRPATSGGARGT
jgi:UDP-N-acetylmuramoyl-L-alanyl-D-glutamate--2,6-diaminopimelate ligase